jgi:hypothetical protein
MVFIQRIISAILGHAQDLRSIPTAWVFTAEMYW